MCRSSERQRETGFSLVEVLCAFAIAAAAISVLMNGLGGALRGSRTVEQHLGARIILNSILEDELAAADTAPARREGKSGPYRWRLDIVRAGAGEAGRAPPPYRFYRLSAAVFWDKGGRLSADVLKLAR